jgi:nucleoside 2-deoxyribosyltransferase
VVREAARREKIKVKRQGDHMDMECPLCDRTDAAIGGLSGRDAYLCKCLVCGQFVFTDEAAIALREKGNKEKRYILSALTRRAFERKSRLELTTYTIPDFLKNTAPPKTPFDVLDPLLLGIHDRTTDLTAFVTVPRNDYPLYFLKRPEQLVEFLLQLKKLGYIDLEARDKGDSARLTLRGWNRAAELRKTGISSSRAFVAMSFAKELDPAYDDAIAPALTDAGWTPVRLDRLEHNDRIDDRIVGEIKRSGMMVADFTGNRPGVYFEAGLAAGLGLPVIWTVRDTDLADVHFDTRQYNHIVWMDPSELRSRLHDRVLATVRPPVVK